MVSHSANFFFSSVALFSVLFRARLKHFSFRKARVLFGSGCSQSRDRASGAARTRTVFDGRHVRSIAFLTKKTVASFGVLGKVRESFVLSVLALGGIIKQSTNRRSGYVQAISSRALPSLAVITMCSTRPSGRCATLGGLTQRYA